MRFHQGKEHVINQLYLLSYGRNILIAKLFFSLHLEIKSIQNVFGVIHCLSKYVLLSFLSITI